MKATLEEETTAQAFKPFTLSLTFESLEELDQFRTIFNIGLITDSFPAVAHLEIRELLQEVRLRRGFSRWPDFEKVSNPFMEAADAFQK